MSTEHQRYSTENQAAGIAKYADSRGLKIVRTYLDHGKSGLRIKGRVALQQLLADALAPNCEFSHILVYDVSRWGRFQDSDESAHYEFICKEAGVTIHYCAEQFSNDGSLTASILKNLKRVMAAEYSRELSTKVLAGQRRIAQLGYHIGSEAGVGLRRMLIDQHGNRKGILRRGEYKSIQTDHIILVPGPPEEVEFVRRIYRLFVVSKKSELTIARLLNRERAMPSLNRHWRYDSVREILTNEKYIGNGIFCRSSQRLHRRRVKNPPDLWVRCESCFEPIVPKKLFERAQLKIKERQQKLSNENVLDELRGLLAKKGRLSYRIIDAAGLSICSRAINERFGGVKNAYALIGYVPPPQGKSPFSDKRLLDYLRRVLGKNGRLSQTLINAYRRDGPRWWDYQKRFGSMPASYRLVGYTYKLHGLGGRRKSTVG